MTGPHPPSASPRTHYAVLGVEPSASPDEIRRAHRQLARVLHPDRLIDAAPAERRFAERRMREVNAAWTVLSDPVRRRDYDRALRAARPSPGPSGPGAGAGPGGRAGSATEPDPDPEVDGYEVAQGNAADYIDQDVPLPGWYFWVLRRGPVVAALVIAIGIFVFTAYAGTAGDEPPSTTPAEAEMCARIVDPVDRSAVLAPCSGPNDGTIVTTVDIARKCPAGTRYVLMRSTYVCVDGP